MKDGSVTCVGPATLVVALCKSLGIKPPHLTRPIENLKPATTQQVARMIAPPRRITPRRPREEEVP